MNEERTRLNFVFTPKDMAQMARIRAAHKLTSNTAAIRFALDFADADITLDGIGGAAHDAERAYRRLGGIIAKRKAFNYIAAALDTINAGVDESVHIIADAQAEAPIAYCGKSADLCGDIIPQAELDDGLAVDALCDACVGVWEANSAVTEAAPQWTDITADVHAGKYNE